jgi:hypothetical protein
MAIKFDCISERGMRHSFSLHIYIFPKNQIYRSVQVCHHIHIINKPSTHIYIYIHKLVLSEILGNYNANSKSNEL